MLAPIPGKGISNAFRDAELLADAVADGLGGIRPLTQALARYHRAREPTAPPMDDFTAPPQPPGPRPRRPADVRLPRPAGCGQPAHARRDGALPGARALPGGRRHV